jgi:hypothetical protein
MFAPSDSLHGIRSSTEASLSGMIPALSRNSAPRGLKVPYPHHRSTSLQQHHAIGAGVTRQLPSLQQYCAEGAYKIAYAQ